MKADDPFYALRAPNRYLGGWDPGIQTVARSVARRSRSRALRDTGHLLLVFSAARRITVSGVRYPRRRPVPLAR